MTPDPVTLQDKLKKRKEERLKAKESEVKDNMAEQKSALESQLRTEREKLQNDEVGQRRRDLVKGLDH